MALRVDNTSDNIQFFPTAFNFRPGTVCGFARVAVQRSTEISWLELDSGAGNVIILGCDDSNSNNLTGFLWNDTGGLGQWDSGWSLGSSVGDWIFFAFTYDTGSVYPKSYWRKLSDSSLSSRTHNSAGPTTGQLSVSSLWCGRNDSANSWINGQITGYRLWSRVLTEPELLAESRSIRARSRTSLLIDAPFLTDGRDYASGLTATLTGVTVEPGPPIALGPSIWTPPTFKRVA